MRNPNDGDGQVAAIVGLEEVGLAVGALVPVPGALAAPVAGQELDALAVIVARLEVRVVRRAAGLAPRREEQGRGRGEGHRSWRE